MILVFLANGTEEVEAITPIDILKRAGKDVVSVAIGTGKNKTITGSHNIKIECDICEEQVKIYLNKKLEMIVIPGGMPGTLNLEKSLDVQNAIDYCVENEIYIGSICAAPSILGRKKLLIDRQAICFPGFEDQLIGAEISEKFVVKDGIYITAKGLGVAVKFALKLVSVLCGEKAAEKIGDGLQID